MSRHGDPVRQERAENLLDTVASQLPGFEISKTKDGTPHGGNFTVEVDGYTGKSYLRSESQRWSWETSRCQVKSCSRSYGGKQRTFKFRNDGTWNIAGIIKALREFAVRNAKDEKQAVERGEEEARHEKAATARFREALPKEWVIRESYGGGVEVSHVNDKGEYPEEYRISWWEERDLFNVNGFPHRLDAGTLVEVLEIYERMRVAEENRS